MTEHRRLALRRETLAALTPDDLAAVNGALPISLPHPLCALMYPSGINACTSEPSGAGCAR